MTEKELLALLDTVRDDPDSWDVVVDAVRAVVADNEALRRQVTSLRDALGHAAPVIEALLNAAKGQLLPVWAMLAPYLQQGAPMGAEWDEKVAAGYERDHRKRRTVPGVHDTCWICGGVLDYYEKTAGNGDVLYSWWAHREHPADGHDERPVTEEGYADVPDPKPRHGEHGTCAECGQETIFLSSYWIHVRVPAVQHPAQFGGPA